MDNLNSNVMNFMEKIKHADTSVAIIGDICLDKYYFLDRKLSEISVETGLETCSVRKTSENLGGAGNVAINLKHLSVGNVDLYGVLGNDSEGKLMKDLMKKEGIGDHTMIQNSRWHSNVYHKMIQNNRELNRYDIGNFNRINNKTIDALIDELEKNMTRYTAVIINEQLLSGLHSHYLVSRMQHIIDDNPDIDFFVDTRNYLGEYKNVIYKMNLSEAERLAGKTGTPLELANEIHSRFGKDLIITLGQEGSLAIDEGTPHFSFGSDFECPTDTVGAGDAFLAGTVAAKASGLSLKDSTDIGNLNASVSILTLYGCGHPTLDDLLKHSCNVKWRYNGWKVSSPEHIYFKNTSIEIIDESITDKLELPKIAIFDHDGTISVLRQGWEKVMTETLMDTLYPAYRNNLSRKEEIAHEVSVLIDRTTGIQTIIQMYKFCDLIREKHWLKEEDILAPEEYKKIYLDNLKATMKYKLDAVQKGILTTDDLTLKGAVDFLHKLKDNGTILYLASGTDREDVIIEAELLGYRDLFGENIYGSVGNVNKDPKQAAIENIINTIDRKYHNKKDTMIFGDGPVEMRIAAENGFRAIGILSDEKQRFGRNEAKRPRLVLAGAEALIPDFSEINELIG